MLIRLGIKQWDLVLVGDGSGNKWGYPCGWACVALERSAMERKVFHGACNNGTVNLAELMAYLPPLTWYASKVHHAKEQVRIRHVHIITDSQYVQSRGEGDAQGAPLTHTVLWQAFGYFNRLGFQLHWHWLRREDAELNHFADAVSKLAREMILGTDLAADAAKKGLDPYKLNPWQ